jgi:hypothetical protein
MHINLSALLLSVEKNKNKTVWQILTFKKWLTLMLRHKSMTFDQDSFWYPGTTLRSTLLKGTITSVINAVIKKPHQCNCYILGSTGIQKINKILINVT